MAEPGSGADTLQCPLFVAPASGRGSPLALGFLALRIPQIVEEEGTQAEHKEGRGLGYDNDKNCDIHLVGSVRLAKAENVFRTVASVLGGKVRRIPDGETGIARSVWIQCQTPSFLGHTHLEMVEPDPGIKRGADPTGEHNLGPA